MYSRYDRFCRGVIPLVGLFALTTNPASVLADGATRDLPDCYTPEVALTVSIAIDPPPATSAVGLEDAPPAGWTVSNISSNGVFDAVNGKVKWGPFFEPFPGVVTYDVTPPIAETGMKCFAGTVSFDGINQQPITGEECILEAGPCDDGNFCTENDICSNGVCAGTPRDCDDGVGCTVDSCDEVNDICVNTPNHGLCDNGDYCDGVETCDALLDCQAGTPVDCSDGVGCTVDSCDEVNDICVNTPNNGLCDNGEFCDGVETCDPVLDCQAGTPVDCADGVGCTVDSCDEVNDICVNTPNNELCDNGEFCDGVETCDPLLDCQTGTPVDCGDAVGCTVDSCDEVNDICVNTPNNGLCDNGDYCDGVETCDPVLDCQAGTPVDCADGVGCTVDSCDEVNDICVNTPNNELCDNGEFCDGVETCDPLLDCQTGTPVDCGDAVGCTVDSCDEVNDICVNTPNNGLCDNGDYCDGVETCDPLLDCQAGTPVDCSDGVGCTVDSCDEVNDICVNTPNNGLCDNGEFCDGVETCDPLLDCQAGTPVDCSDGVGCTVDSCDEVNDICVNTPNNGLCDNGEFCDGVETCDPLLDCQAGTPVDCSDGVGCTVDSCDEVNDICVNTPNNELCDNGEFCDGVETCDPLLDCQAGAPVDCDDGVGCTVDSCDEVNDTCVNAASNGLCDNGQYCDGAETCDPLLDCQAGAPVDCDDGVGCTVDSCDEVNDTCVNAASNGLCDNGQYCDGAETCDPLLDCQAGAPVDCDDGVGCTVDSCDEVNDTCVNAASNGLCDNGQYCDGVETCDLVLDCQAGAPIDCDDSVGCTVDSCDEVNDTCVNAASNGLCDNGQYCDGVETCDLVLDCQAVVPIDCDDSVGCTVDSCDEVNDTCVNAASNGLCDNGDYCDGVETCDPMLDCQAGTDPCPGQYCDEIDDVCLDFCQWIPADEPQAPCGSCTDCSCATCEDGQVEMCEMIGYACQWKNGCNDNLADMTRAAYIWKNTECYCWDDAQLNWLLNPCPAPGTGCCAGASRAGDGEIAFDPALTASEGEATALLPKHETIDGARTRRITINIHAPVGTSAVGLEYVIPDGWEVLDASDGGQWDELHRKVKWGPFLDGLSRKVTLTVHRVAHGGPPGRFYGTVSFDGVNQPIHQSPHAQRGVGESQRPHE